MTLHEAIEAVIKEAEQPLEPGQIAQQIVERELYERKDGKPISGAQVSARVAKYPDRFEKMDGKVTLKQNGAPSPALGQVYTSADLGKALGVEFQSPLTDLGEGDLLVHLAQTDPTWKPDPELTEEQVQRLANGQTLLVTGEPDELTFHGPVTVTQATASVVHFDLPSEESSEVVEEEPPAPEPPKGFVEPTLEALMEALKEKGLHLPEELIRRYHLSLKASSAVVLSGFSGCGKTFLAQTFADCLGACHLTLTSFSGGGEAVNEFLEKANQANQEEGRPRPFHLIVDDIEPMGLWETLHAFGAGVCLPNLTIIATVNSEEARHFPNRLLDRVQWLGVEPTARNLLAHLGDAPYRGLVLQIWQAWKGVAPFGFRLINEIRSYIEVAKEHELAWEVALDEQMVQKLLPRIRPGHPGAPQALRAFLDLVADKYPLSRRGAEHLLASAGG